MDVAQEETPFPSRKQTDDATSFIVRFLQERKARITEQSQDVPGITDKRVCFVWLEVCLRSSRTPTRLKKTPRITDVLSDMRVARVYKIC